MKQNGPFLGLLKKIKDWMDVRNEQFHEKFLPIGEIFPYFNATSDCLSLYFAFNWTGDEQAPIDVHLLVNAGEITVLSQHVSIKALRDEECGKYPGGAYQYRTEKIMLSTEQYGIIHDNLGASVIISKNNRGRYFEIII